MSPIRHRWPRAAPLLATPLVICGWALCSLVGVPAWAQPGSAMMQPDPKDPLGTTPANVLPAAIQNVGFDQRLGERVPLDLLFTDESGREVRFAELFGKRPVVLVPVYFDCPMLCGQVIHSLTNSLAKLELSPGRDYEVVAVSFNAANTPEDAARSKNTAMGRFGRRETAGGWHFLTGSSEEIRRFTTAIGFRFEPDTKTGELAHTAGFVVASPTGELSRYFFGLDFPERDLRLALVDAAEERIGSLADHVFLYCFRYDPATGKYTALALNIVRLAGATTVALLALGLGLAFSRERRRHRISLGTA